jgi:ATP-dependent protease HslVU (ClpYQ) peptidase subunit
MTTIAYKDGVLVADTQATSGSWKRGTTVKIHRVGRLLVGFAGDLASCQRFLSWVKSGLEDDSPLEEGSEAFVIEPCGRLTSWQGAIGHVMNFGEFYSTGSGCSYAVGAMAAGATAEEAVLVAAKYDVYTNDKLTVLHL